MERNAEKKNWKGGEITKGTKRASKSHNHEHTSGAYVRELQLLHRKSKRELNNKNGRGGGKKGERDLEVSILGGENIGTWDGGKRWKVG